MESISNAVQVTAAKPGVHKIEKAPGLYLRRTATGGSWVFRYRAGIVEGRKKDGSIGLVEKKREMGLGSAIGPGAVMLAEARRKAIDYSRQVCDGGDPLKAKDEARKAAEAKAREEARKVTFAHATDAYVNDFADGWKHRHARANWHNPVKRYAYPIIGDMLLADIRVGDVRRVLDAARKVPGIAKRLRGYIALVFDDAVSRGWLDENAPNPAAVQRHKGLLARRAVARKHYRRLALDDAPAAFRELRELSAKSPALAAWAFMIATAVRPINAVEARWSEIDLDKKLWTFPERR